jgi:hypothetical protein
MKPYFPLVDDVDLMLALMRAGTPDASADELCARFEEWHPELYRRLLNPAKTLAWVLRIRTLRQSGELRW